MALRSSPPTQRCFSQTCLRQRQVAPFCRHRFQGRIHTCRAQPLQHLAPNLQHNVVVLGAAPRHSNSLQGRRPSLVAASNKSSVPTPKFRLHRITGDGSCQFRAIVQGVQFAATGSMLSMPAEATAAQNLRLKVVQELARNKELIEPFIAGITDDWAAYLQRMTDPNVWGGEPELVMAVNVIRRPITVHHLVEGVVTPIVTYGEELGMEGSIHLLWSVVHYDLLIPE